MWVALAQVRGSAKRANRRSRGVKEDQKGEKKLKQTLESPKQNKRNGKKEAQEQVCGHRLGPNENQSRQKTNGGEGTKNRQGKIGPKKAIIKMKGLHYVREELEKTYHAPQIAEKRKTTKSLPEIKIRKRGWFLLARLGQSPQKIPKGERNFSVSASIKKGA